MDDIIHFLPQQKQDQRALLFYRLKLFSVFSIQRVHYKLCSV